MVTLLTQVVVGERKVIRVLPAFDAGFCSVCVRGSHDDDDCQRVTDCWPDTSSFLLLVMDPSLLVSNDAVSSNVCIMAWFNRNPVCILWKESQSWTTTATESSQKWVYLIHLFLPFWLQQHPPWSTTMTHSRLQRSRKHLRRACLQRHTGKVGRSLCWTD